MKKLFYLLSFMVFLFTHVAVSKENTGKDSSRKKKVQEVRFDDESIDGVVRKPDGLYLVQKKSVDFIPLYQIRKSFDENIKGSVEYLR
jgi:hypothetical protein